jgi:hypothetical protein
VSEHEEALRHATAGRDWRTECYGYVDRLLDDMAAARSTPDVADLERLWRARPFVPKPLDHHGTEWSVP